jgi:hypothetical protein
MKEWFKLHKSDPNSNAGNIGKGAFLLGDSLIYTKLCLEDLTLKDLRMIDRCHRRRLRENQIFSETIKELAKRIHCSADLIQVPSSILLRDECSYSISKHFV